MHQKAKIASSLITLFIVTLLTTTIKPAAAVIWSEQLGTLPTYECFDGHPSITQLANGTIYVVWTRDVMGNPKIYYSTSSDHGDTWSEEMNLTDTYAECKDMNPSIAQAVNGAIWVAWSSNRPPIPPPPEPDFSIDASPKNLTIPQGYSDTSTIVITSLNNFNDPVALTVPIKPDNVTTTLNPDQLTPPPNGTANSTLTILVETTATPGNYTLVVMGKGGGKSHSVQLSLEITESSGGESGEATFSQTSPSESTEDYEIFYKCSSDGGATWSDDVQFTDNAVHDLNPSIIQTVNGTLWIFWQSNMTGNQEIFYTTSSDDGSSWSEAQGLTVDSNPDRAPSAIQTVDGRIWVAWSSYRTGYFEIFYKTYNGSSWSNATRLTNSTNIDTSPSILQTFDGTIWLFWSSCENSAQATTEIFYKCSSDGGATWSDDVQFTDNADEDTWASTTQTDDLKIWVLWASNRTGNFDLFYRTSLVGDITGPSSEPDGVVDNYDLIFVCNAYGDKEGDTGWNERKIADITGPENPPFSRRFPPNGVVDVYDLAAVGKNYGAT